MGYELSWIDTDNSYSLKIVWRSDTGIWISMDEGNLSTPFNSDTDVKILDFHKNKILRLLNENYVDTNNASDAMINYIRAKIREYDFNVSNAVLIMVE